MVSELPLPCSLWMQQCEQQSIHPGWPGWGFGGSWLVWGVCAGHFWYPLSHPSQPEETDGTAEASVHPHDPSVLRHEVQCSYPACKKGKHEVHTLEYDSNKTCSLDHMQSVHKKISVCNWQGFKIRYSETKRFDITVQFFTTGTNNINTLHLCTHVKKKKNSQQ